MRFTPENTVAICVDYQERLMPAIHDGQNILKQTEILVRGLNTLEVPIIVTQQYTKGLGGTVEPIHTALGEYEPMDKMTFSAYDTDTIQAAIEKYNRKNVILFGVETHICVLQTALGLKDAGYNVMMIEDCCGSRKISDRECGLKRAMCEGIFVGSSEMVLFELLQKAGTDSFKIISKLVK